MSKVQHYLRFRVGEEWYGVRVDEVIEVLHLVALNEMPASRPDVLGVMRLRELVIPVMDLRLHFGLAASYSLTTPIIVVRTPASPIGFAVDEVDDLVRVDESQITPQDASASRYFVGIARLSDSLLLLLDASLLHLEYSAS